MKPDRRIVVTELAPDVGLDRVLTEPVPPRAPPANTNGNRDLAWACAELGRMVEEDEMPDDWALALRAGMLPEDMITMARESARRRAARKRAA